jgi:hypothetical protein
MLDMRDTTLTSAIDAVSTRAQVTTDLAQLILGRSRRGFD